VIVRFFLRLIPVLLLLAIWEKVAESDQRLEFLIGSPGGIYASFRASGHFWNHLVVTLWEASAGLTLGMGVGSVVGLALWKTPRVERFSRPYVLALGAIPMVAIGPALVFWWGTGPWAKILIATFCTAPVALAQARIGASTANQELVEMANAFAVPQRTVFWRLVAPSALIWMLASLRLNVGLALLGAFSGEFLASRAGLGHIIVVSEGLYDMNGMWVGVVGILAVALFLHGLAVPLETWARRFTISQTNT
jgi:NitT/TauT family transport system permease protein